MNTYVLTLNFKDYVAWIFFLCEAFFVESSELANGIDLLERSPTSVLDISLVKSNYLHQLVSEGNLNGVRSVHFDAQFFLHQMVLYILMDHMLRNLRSPLLCIYAGICLPSLHWGTIAAQSFLCWKHITLRAKPLCTWPVDGAAQR